MLLKKSRGHQGMGSAYLKIPTAGLPVSRPPTESRTAGRAEIGGTGYLIVNNRGHAYRGPDVGDGRYTLRIATRERQSCCWL